MPFKFPRSILMKPHLIRIILVEDHHVVRDGIKLLLDSEPRIEVVAEASNVNEVIDLIKKGVQCDIILTDINMEGMSGLELIKQLHIDESGPKFLILSMHDHENYVSEAFKTGASGYLLKNVTREELIYAVFHVAGGGKYICHEIALKLLDKLNNNVNSTQEPLPDGISLTGREVEVLGMIAEGMTNQEIADKLFSSKRTIEGYRKNLLSKTGTRNTAALIKFAIHYGLLKS